MPKAVDRTISAAVRALIHGRGLKADDLAARIGVSHGTMNSRLNCRTSWTAAEVRDVADYFEVRINDLYDGLGGLVSPDPSGGVYVSRRGSKASEIELMQYQSLAAA